MTSLATRLVHFDAAPGDGHHPTVTPIYQTATFGLESDDAASYDYTRSGNPTRAVLETVLADLESGINASAFASGMAAIVAATSIVEHGGLIVAGDDLYGGTYRYLTRYVARHGIKVEFTNTTSETFLRSIKTKRPSMVLLETPTNPVQHITDISQVAEHVHSYGGLLVVDNSMMSPALQQPLTLGADLVVHSATKFLSGHSHVLAGAVIAQNQEVADRIRFYQNAAGTGLSPFDSWLLLNGIKTLPLRIEKQVESARVLAEFLDRHKRVRNVYYPGLPNHPGRDTHERQASGPGAVISFETGDREASHRIVNTLKLFSTTVSFGGVASSVELPSVMSHASVPIEERGPTAFSDDIIRLSIGIEDVHDLTADIDQALTS